MAIVGEAHVLVKAITTDVERDIKRAFQGINGAAAESAGSELGSSFSRGLRRNLNSNVFSRIADGIAEMVPEAERARESFQKMVRTGYFVGTGLSVLLGAISSLIGGLTALVGAAGAAAAGLIAVAGAAVALRVGFGIAGYALRGISQAVAAATQANGGYSKSLKEIAFDAEEAALSVDRAAINLENAREAVLRTQDLPAGSRVRREAELAYKEAELAYRRAQAAKKAGATGQPGVADPYAGLTPSQKQFAKYLASLKPILDNLKEATAKGFLPILEDQMRRLINAGVLTILEKQFYNIGVGMGEMSKSFTDIILARKTLESLDDLLFRISQQLPPIGTVFGNLLDGFINSLRLADPATRNFIKYLEKKSGKFADFFTVKGDVEDSPIGKFFLDAEKMLERFLGIFGNVFKTLQNIIAVNFGPGSGGEMLVTWLEEVTTGWANMGKTVSGKVDPAFRNFFIGASRNTIKILESVGALVKEFIKLGDMPEIGETFDILKAGAPLLGEMIRAGIEAGPAFARFLVSITRVFKALADSEGPTVFFDTLADITNAMADILSNETVQKILKLAGKFLAWGLAIGTVTKVFKFMYFVMFGGLQNIFSLLGRVIQRYKLLTGVSAGATAAGATGAGAAGAGGIRGFFSGILKEGGKAEALLIRLQTAFGKLTKIGGKTPLTLFITFLAGGLYDAWNNGTILKTLFENLNKDLEGPLGDLQKAFENLFDTIFGRGGKGEGLNALGEAFDDFYETARPFFEFFNGMGLISIFTGLEVVINQATNLINLLTSYVNTALNIFVPFIEGVLDLLNGKFKSGMTKIFGSMAIMLLGIVEVIVNTMVGVVNVLINSINGVLKLMTGGPVRDFIKTMTGIQLPGELKIPTLKYVDWTGDARKALYKTIDGFEKKPLSPGRPATGGQGALERKGIGPTRPATGAGAFLPSTGTPIGTMATTGLPSQTGSMSSGSALSEADIRRISLAVSTSQGAKTPVTINVYGAPGMSEAEIAEMVSRKIAFAMTQGGY
jgi:hypothetical protein